MTLCIEMYSNLDEKSFKSNSYIATTIKFQALGTTYSLCLSCYTRKYFFGPPLPIRSAVTTDRTKNSFSGVVKSIYISLKTQYKPPSDKKQNWQCSPVTYHPFIFFHTVHIGYELTTG